jgi:hypothetical protein
MINVYYGCFSSNNNKDEESSQQYVEQPIPVNKTLIKSTGLDANNGLFKCPAVKDFIFNLYQIVATYDYTLLWDGKELTTPDYDQNFYDKCVIARELKSGFFSYVDPPIYLFADCDKLEVTLLPAIFEKSKLDAITIPGVFDIANHLRKLELAVILNKPNEAFKITSGMPLYYVKFNTKEKINLIRFQFTQELYDLFEPLLKYRKYTKNIIPLNWYYKVVRRYYKKKYLEIIKKNILN